MAAEKRRFHRAFQPFHVQIRNYNQLAETSQQVEALDISAGGLGFQSPHPFELGVELEIKLLVPHTSPLVLVGKIMWSRPQSQDLMRYGVEFLSLTSDQQLQLDELVQFLRKSRPS